MIFEGVAQGDYSFSCVRGRISKLTTVLPDSSVISVSGGEDTTIAWISDSGSNPCLPGTYVSNVINVLRKQTLLNIAAGASQAISEGEQIRTVSAEGVERSVNTGDSLRIAGANAVSGAVTGIKDFINRRSDEWDAIHVPAGQDVIIHVSQELLLKPDKTRQIYDKQKVVSSSVRTDSSLD